MPKIIKPTKNPAKQPSKNIDAAIGATVRQLRIAQGFSQEEMARQLGITPRQVRQFECGDNRLGATALYQIAEFFEVGVGYLYRAINAKRQYGDNVRTLFMPMPKDAKAPFISDEELIGVINDYQNIRSENLRATVRHFIKRIGGEG